HTVALQSLVPTMLPSAEVNSVN
ncbi:uncharacterized protein METZ01_LOCUS345907, partial [marine metagenome]